MQELDVKNIKVKDETHARLGRRGHYFQTMNQIITETLDTLEEFEKGKK